MTGRWPWLDRYAPVYTSQSTEGGVTKLGRTLAYSTGDCLAEIPPPNLRVRALVLEGKPSLHMY